MPSVDVIPKSVIQRQLQRVEGNDRKKRMDDGVKEATDSLRKIYPRRKSTEKTTREERTYNGTQSVEEPGI